MAVLYAIISVLNLMRAATRSQCGEIKRGVTWDFWVRGRPSVPLHSESLHCYSMNKICFVFIVSVH